MCPQSVQCSFVCISSAARKCTTVVTQALDTKQGNRQNFATIKERNDHIMKEMKLREDGLRKLQEQIQDLQAQISAIEQSRIRLKEVTVALSPRLLVSVHT